MDRTFVYGKLGAAWGHFEYEGNSSFDFCPGCPQTFTQEGSKTFLGVLIGVGFEYALTENWTTKFEYNYIDYGNQVVDFAPVSCQNGTCTTSSSSAALKETKQIAKLGLNYRFGANQALAAAPAFSGPAFNWTGFYVGLHGGAGWLASSFAGSGGGPVNSGVGALGGVQAGYNMQFRQFVVGLEGEFWGSDLSDRSFRSFAEPAFSSSSESKSRNIWDAALSVRSGIAFDRTFIYGKLGAVWGHFEYESNSSFNNVNCCSGSSEQQGSKTFLGVLIGVGFEYALADNWTTKFEYNYIDYGNQVVDFAPVDCNNGVCTTASRSEALKEVKQIAKLGLNYKF